MISRMRGALTCAAVIALMLASVGVARAQEIRPYSEISLVGPTLILVDGHPLSAAVPGKQNEVRFSLRNKGLRSFPALPVTFHEWYRTKLETQRLMIRLPAHATATATVKFSFTEADCWDPLKIQVDAQVDAVNTHVLGDLTIPAACSQRPLLEILGSSYEGGDGDGVPEPGERLFVTVALMNREREDPSDFEVSRGYPAVNISGSLVSNTPGVTVVQPSARWPDAKSASSPESILPLGTFEIRIAESVPRVWPVEETGFGFNSGPGWDGKCGKPNTPNCMPATFNLSLNIVASGFAIRLPIANQPTIGPVPWSWSDSVLVATIALLTSIGFLVRRRRRRTYERVAKR